MRRWIAPTLAIVTIGAAALLWLELRGPAARADGTGMAAPTAAPTVSMPVAHAPELPVAPAAPAEAAAPEKLDPQSDAFFYRFDEVVPANLTRKAAHCYDGARRVHRNQKLKLRYKLHIKDGVVTVHDVTVKSSNLDYPGLEDCFIRAVAESTWRDDSLPDWEQDDELVLNPERGMKKYSQANVDDEGDGPVGAAVMTPGQAPPRSDSATINDW